MISIISFLLTISYSCYSNLRVNSTMNADWFMFLLSIS